MQTTSWFCPTSAPQSYKHSSFTLGQSQSTELIEYNDWNPAWGPGSDTTYNLSKSNRDWVFRFTSLPPPRYALTDLVKTVAPCICSWIIAILWMVLTRDMRTAITFGSFMSAANVGVLILLWIVNTVLY